jgi:glycerol-3-phosphate dehydrogenase
MNFSALNRNQIVNQLSTTTFDVLIIGGGITGAGIALDAATRGMKVALVEKNDFASGTSNKSTKLIHGGLRYLKQFDFWLVKEVGSERAIVHKLAPHLVVPEKMLLPIIEGGTYGKWLTSVGLKIYDILAKVTGEDKRKMLDKQEALEIEPLLPDTILEGAGFYAEYRTDDARLTIEVLKTAVKKGAVALNYIQVTHFLYQKNKVNGLVVLDKNTDKTLEIKAKFVVNAAGPWVDDVRLINHPGTSKYLHLTKGVHLVFDRQKLPVKHAIYFDVPDGRMMFAIPRGKTTYIGTTDTNYQSDKDNIGVSLTDALYLISAVNHMFPKINLTVNDILSSWAGVRPLIHEEGKKPGELSRKDEIYVSDSGLISIAGGKLTGYRKMSERVTDLVCKKYYRKFDIEFKKSNTENIGLCGGDYKNYNAVKNHLERLLKELNPYGFNSFDVAYLIHNYGTQTQKIIEIFIKGKTDKPQVNLALAELDFCFENEMVLKPMDFLSRRTGRLYFDIKSIEILKQPIVNAFAKKFNWTPRQIEKELQLVDQYVSKATDFTTG